MFFEGNKILVLLEDNIHSFYKSLIQSLTVRETFCGTLLCLCGRNDGYLGLRIRNK